MRQSGVGFNLVNIILDAIQWNETEVIEAMKQPSKERDRLFENLKKYGILKSNAKNKSIVMRERAQGSHEVVMCAGCKGFYSSRRIHEHKKKCTTEHALSTGVVKFYPTVPNVSKEIKSNILDRFRNDDVGNLCRADKAIVLMGTKLWSKSSKKERKVIMSDLHILGNLILKKRQRTKRRLERQADEVDDKYLQVPLLYSFMSTI